MMKKDISADGSGTESDEERPKDDHNLSFLDLMKKVTINQSLSKFRVNLKRNDTDETQNLELTLTNLIFNKEECKVATFRDITRSRQLVKMKKHNDLLHMLSSTVTHEMVTPLKAMITLASIVARELQDHPRAQETNLILVTARLMLA
jgi:nitrogen-specific signal transduction histidine kinase